MADRKLAILVDHPNPDSFTLSVACAIRRVAVLTHRYFRRVLNALKVRIEAHINEVRQGATQYFAPAKGDWALEAQT